MALRNSKNPAGSSASPVASFRCPVSPVRFPFWMLVPAGLATEPPRGAPRRVATFSSAARAVAYWEAADDVERKLNLVSRSSRPHVRKVLSRFGVTRVCHDRRFDGAGGTEMSVADLFAGWKL